MTYTLKLVDGIEEVQKMEELKFEEAAFYVAAIFMNLGISTKATVINDISGECKEYNRSTLPVVHGIRKQREGGSLDELKFRVEGALGCVSLFQGKETRDDGIYYGLQHGTMVKSYYSEADRLHSLRMRDVVPIQDGDRVIIEGDLYICRVIGNYSTCCTFEKVGD